MSRPHLTTEERRRRLALRHRLAPERRTASTEAIAEDLVGLHSTDPASVYLATWARQTQPDSRALDTALYDRRTLVRVLGMRRTTFVVTRGHAALLHQACAAPLAGKERKRLIGLIEDQGVAADGAGWLAEVEAKTLAALEKQGEAVARELAGEVPELKQRLRFGGQAKWAGEVGISTRVLFLLSTEGRIVRARPRGTWVSSQYRWAPTHRWLGEPLPQPPAEVARRRLAEAWLRSYGPATFDDLKWWTGWTVRHTRQALADLETAEVELDQGRGWVLADDVAGTEPSPPWVALLPALDATTMGWKDRSWYLGDHAGDLFDRNGNAGPTIWADGRIVGGWAQSKGGTVVTRLLEPVSATHQRLITHEAERLQAALGETVVTPRFRTPLEKQLAAG